MRARYARGADRRPAQNDSRCRCDTRKVRRRSAAYSGPARARGRCGRRLPRHFWIRRQDRRPAFEPLRSDRKLSVKRSRRKARSRAALQESRNPAHRRATFQKCRDAALARCDAGIRSLGKADGSAAAARTVRQDSKVTRLRARLVSSLRHLLWIKEWVGARSTLEASSWLRPAERAVVGSAPALGQVEQNSNSYWSGPSRFRTRAMTAWPASIYKQEELYT